MPPLKPEAAARENIDAALVATGWAVQDKHQTNLKAGLGVAIREFKGKAGHGFADYLLYVDGKAIGAIEAKAEGTTLSGVEPQSAKYSQGLPDNLPAWRLPLPFLYESTAVETHFTNLLDPLPRGRRVFSFHRPEFLRAQFVTTQPASHQFLAAAEAPSAFGLPTLRTRLRNMPPLATAGLWQVQAQAVANLEESLADDRPRSLVVMATGSGKTVTAVTAIYRLVKHADARKVLFLVDRSNLGRQALREFQNYITPDDGRKFTELYNVQLLTSNKVDPVANVVITTIQRLYSILQGHPELDPELEEGSQFETGAGLIKEPVPVVYNPAFPIEQFDFIFTDECHRSIYNLWRQVLEYFDAYLVGLTATPSKQTLGFFRQNLVMDYNHEQAVADGINVDFDVYRINTQITQSGSTVEAGWHVTKRDRLTRKQRSELMDEDFVYPAVALDRDVVATDQIRTVVRTFKARLFTEIFPGRTAVPKTLVYAKDDAHAEDVVEVLREEFAQGNDFAQKITYRTTGEKPEVLLQKFRNAYYPRIVVTVDMIATGTDVKPIEIVMFMRAVKSRTFFEQMKGRGVRVINPTDLRSVTADAVNKDHFVIVDCVGLCEHELVDTQPLVKKPSAALKSVLQSVAYGARDPDTLSTLAGRLARLDRQLGEPDRQAIARTAAGQTLKDIVSNLIAALDVDNQTQAARAAAALPPNVDPSVEQVDAAAQQLLEAAAAPLAYNADLRHQIETLKQRYEQTIDEVSEDVVLEAGFSEQAKERARSTVQSFEQFIAEHKDEITALQVLYSRPYAQRLRFRDVRDLADAIKAPPRSWTPEALWRAYQTLDESRVRGATDQRLLTDLVSLVRYALKQDDTLIPFPDHVNQRFDAWLAHQQSSGANFTPDQIDWLQAIRNHVATSASITPTDLDLPPFTTHGGLARAYNLFGENLAPLLDELNEVLAA